MSRWPVLFSNLSTALTSCPLLFVLVAAGTDLNYGCTWGQPLDGGCPCGERKQGQYPMPGNSEHAPPPKPYLGSPQRVRLEDTAERKKKIKDLHRASNWLPHLGGCAYSYSRGVWESKALQELHCGHRVAPVPVRNSPAERWQARRRTAHRASGRVDPWGKADP